MDLVYPVPGLQAARKAKIVCTIGPASRSQEMIERLSLAGMDVVRLNLSHGRHEEHASVIERVRRVSRKHEKPMAIIADLQGPKIRTGTLAGGPVKLMAGQGCTLTTRRVPGTAELFSTDYARLPLEVKKGDRILIDDGLIELRVQGVGDSEVRCEVVNGGDLSDHKGINLPGVKVGVPCLTRKDRRDLAFALAHGVNYVALSFVRSAADVKAARAAMRRLGHSSLLIAKIEKAEAVENLEEILKASDGVMVARGDLGVEMNPEKVPVTQKLIIRRAWEHRLPTITATQMLDSMTRNPRPTRAEASDVANAVFDGTGSVMLSGETATGKYPIESVIMMDKIVRETEACLHDEPKVHRSLWRLNVAEAVSQAVCSVTESLPVKCIAVFTETGTTARLIAHYRPPCSIIAFSTVQETRRRMALVWGVTPRRIRRVRDIDDLAAVAGKRLLEERLVAKGDLVGVVAGTPLNIKGTTNLMKLHRV